MTSLEDGPEPVVGLFALRTFRVSANGFLVPLSFTSADWADGTCIARCGRGHAAPADGCTCGVYSLRDLRDLRVQYWTARRLVAVVALEGQTVEGTKGWRSQAARVIDVWTGSGRWGLPAEQDALLRQNLPGVRFHPDLDRMLAGYPELVPAPRPRSAAFARAGRSWWSSVIGLRVPVRRALVWAAAVTLLTMVLVGVTARSVPVYPVVLMAQLAASLLMLAGLIVVSEFFTQLLGVLFVGASPPLLLTPRRPVLRMWRYASGFLTAGTLASLATGRPIPTGSIAVFVTLWVVLLAVERFTLGFARSPVPVRLMTAPRGAHPGTGDRRGWKDEQRLPGARRWTRRGVVPVMITPPPPPTPAGA